MPAVLRIAGYQDERSVHTRAVRVLLSGLAERTGGDGVAEFEPDVATRGRKAADLLSMVEGGDLDVCYFSSGYLARRVPALGVFDIPFQFSDRREVRARLGAGLGTLLAREIAARTGYVALAFWDDGLRHISNGRRPVRTPGDCSGLRIRTLPNESYHATFRALGMEPVAIDVALMVKAIASGEVDAQENPLTNIQLFGLQRFHRFGTTTAHFSGIAVVLCNAQVWAGWPESFRFALAAAMGDATAAQWRFAAEDDIACRASLVGEGVEIIDPDAAGRESFRSAVAPVIERQRALLPAEVVRMLAGADTAAQA